MSLPCDRVRVMTSYTRTNSPLDRRNSRMESRIRRKVYVRFGRGLRHEVVLVIVVLGVMPRHNPLSHQRYPTERCGKVTTRTAPPDNEPTAYRLASHP